MNHCAGADEPVNQLSAGGPVSPGRVVATRGNVGGAVLAQLRETIAVILDLP